MGDAVSIIAIGFAGYFVAVAAHITFNSLYACLFVSNLVVRARVGIGAMFLLSAIANFVQGGGIPAFNSSLGLGSRHRVVHERSIKHWRMCL
ncbi:hypothetical protein L0F63_001922 [Massospora cicadina]|nr:hypothetical protein L0F63_001922 [Massospora cicadina]